MIALTGKLRQSGQVTIKERPLVKIWVEHEMPRDSGTPDLKIEEFFLEPAAAEKLPKAGSEVTLSVRPYPKGRDVGYQVTGVIAPHAPARAA